MLSIRGNRLYEGFLEVASGACKYLGEWTYDSPVIISAETNYRMHRVQQLLMKCIRYFVEHYDEYRDMMPVSDKVYEILSLCKRKPYRIGSYRTDFAIDENNQIKLIEITCRFALNGFFTSGFTNLIADSYIKEDNRITKIDDYTAFYDDLLEYFGDFNHVCLLKGADNRNETKYLIPVFENAGYPVHVIPTNAITENLHLFENAAVIGELAHDEICQLPRDTISAIIDAHSLNDFRTIFLIHDKRFFAFLNHMPFMQAALNDVEIAELGPYLVPTFTQRMEPDIWQQAKHDKDRWIMKPSVLGKSINVFAGYLMEADEWQNLFASDRLDCNILQSYITQRKFHGIIGDKKYYDYVVGTLLFFEEHFYGPGIFRASSYPITNKVDDRKIAPLVTADTGYFNSSMIL